MVEREKREKKETPAQRRNKAKILAYLSDLEAVWPRRQEYSKLILGYKKDNQIYCTLTPDDLTNIEEEALELIKKRSSRYRKEMYESLRKQGKGGNVQAAKEFLDRTEGKIPDKLDANINQSIVITRKSRDGEDD